MIRLATQIEYTTLTLCELIYLHDSFMTSVLPLTHPHRFHEKSMIVFHFLMNMETITFNDSSW